MQITRRDTRWGHKYDVTKEGKLLSKDLPGITTVLGVLSKPGLAVWGARMGVDGVKEIVRKALESSRRPLPGGPMKESDWELAPRLAGLQETLEPILTIDGYKASQDYMKSRGQRGTDLHTLVEKLIPFYRLREEGIADAMVRNTMLREEKLESEDTYLMLLAFRDWIHKTRPKILSVERSVACVECGYGCTLDIHGTIDEKPWVLDVKSSAGIYESYTLQLVAQDHALQMTSVGAVSHSQITNNPSNTGVLWVNEKADGGCQVVGTPNTEADFSAVRSCLNLYNWKRNL